MVESIGTAGAVQESTDGAGAPARTNEKRWWIFQECLDMHIVFVFIKTNDNNNFKTGYKKGDLTLSHEYFLKTILERLCITQNIDNIDCTLKGEFELLRVNDSKT